ncbi:MAG: MXAN_2562 family outer membrane beta-barrel protein [Nitrospiraceae bacterium]|nr:MXAN_2562 family outer membrane beta-barrel protein [Nitrospiraceae bacterium]
MKLLRHLLVFLLLAIPAAASAADVGLEPPQWSLEFKGGRFYPDIDNWKDYYGSTMMGRYAGSLAFTLLRQLEVGVEAGYSRDRGFEYAPINGIMTGQVTYEVAPVSLFVLARAAFYGDQLFVPYIGGGFTRVYYREKTTDSGIIRGSADGYHWRGGIEMLLDNIDTSAANSMFLDYGVQHTYLFAEIEVVHAMKESINLGGNSYLAGFRFEF